MPPFILRVQIRVAEFYKRFWLLYQQAKEREWLSVAEGCGIIYTKGIHPCQV